MRALTQKHTLAASYTGYVTQAIVNNLAPLLFIVFQTSYGLSFAQLAALITVNFGTQLAVDAASALFIDKIGYRRAAVLAHILCTAGMVCLGLLPALLPSPYAGLLIAIALNAIGGGLIEVIISPIVEALPGDQKTFGMSLLHSFYCWGYVLVVLVSTAFFAVFGTGCWMWLCFLWALVPLCNCLLFARVPLWSLLEEGTEAIPLRKLFTKKLFLLLLVAMVCAGASEQSMSQWASLFAETGLGISKTMGDLLGPCVFAVLMGTARIIMGRLRLRLEAVLMISSVLCIGSYLLAILAPHPALSLVGCGLSGFAVGSMWPTVFSLAARAIPKGGTAMYAFFALAGDLGCAGGPGLVGMIGNACEAGGFSGLMALLGDSLKAGLLFALMFPALMLLSMAAIRTIRGRQDPEAVS